MTVFAAPSPDAISNGALGNDAADKCTRTGRSRPSERVEKEMKKGS